MRRQGAALAAMLATALSNSPTVIWIGLTEIDFSPGLPGRIRPVAATRGRRSR